jgi:hypothetical protein
LERLGKSLFTPHGTPNPRFYQLKDGMTGVFGPEIASGSFPLLCDDEYAGVNGDRRVDFYIEEKFRRQGAGTQALREFFAHTLLAVRSL